MDVEIRKCVNITNFEIWNTIAYISVFGFPNIIHLSLLCYDEFIMNSKYFNQKKTCMSNYPVVDERNNMIAEVVLKYIKINL